MPTRIHPTLLQIVLTVAMLLSLCALALAEDFSPRLQPIVWTKMEEQLPPSIILSSGYSLTSGGPLHAWLVDIEYSDRNLMLRPYLSVAPRGKQPVSEMATQLGAYVAVNGGYFDMTSVPAKTFSLVESEGKTLVPNITRIHRPNGVYTVGRAAFGVREDRSFDIAWVLHDNGRLLQLPAPLPNTPAAAAPAPSVAELAALKPWPVRNAIGAGPRLLQDGQVHITYDEEVFFGSGFRGDVPYPRTAIGIAPNGHLLILVADGSQPGYSDGLTLPEVAEELKKLGCTEAINFDGGGSTTLAINGKVINRPSGLAVERNVTTMLAVVPNAPPPLVASRQPEISPSR